MDGGHPEAAWVPRREEAAESHRASILALPGHGICGACGAERSCAPT
jgi:hypothetical protein